MDASRCTRSLLVAAAAGWIPAGLLAQDVIDPSPSPAPARIYGGPSMAEPFAVPEAPFSLAWGPFAVRPHVAYTYTYTDGVRSRPGLLESTSRQAFTAGAAVELGEKWTANYSATWNTYSNSAFKDGFEQTFGLNGGVSYELWSASLRHQTSLTDSPNIETARQTKQDIHATSLLFTRPINNQWAAELALGQNLRYVRQAPNVFEYTAEPGVSYRFNPALVGHVGVEFGKTDVTDGSTDMETERPQVGLTWRASSRLGVTGFVGREKRSFDDDLTPTTRSTNYGASMAYQLLANTSISVTGSQQAGASYFGDLLSETTAWGISAQQGLPRGFSLSAGVTWSDVEYQLIRSNLPIVREDDRTSYFARLSTRFLRHGAVSVSWRRSENDSSADAFAFSSDQYSLDLSYRF